MELHTIETLPLLSSLSKAYGPPAKARWELLADYLRTTLDLLGTPPKWLLDNLSAIPTPEKHRPDKWGPPRAVSSGNLSGWLHKREQMPTFRMAASLALLELRYLAVRAEMDAAGPGDEFATKRFNLALEQHAEIAREPSLAPYLLAYRLAIYDRLRKDKGRSPAHAAMFRSYRQCIPPEVIQEIARHIGH